MAEWGDGGAREVTDLLIDAKESGQPSRGVVFPGNAIAQNTELTPPRRKITGEICHVSRKTTFCTTKVPKTLHMLLVPVIRISRRI